MGLLIPAQELTTQEIANIRQSAKNRAAQILIDKRVVTDPNALVYRQVVVGDSSSTDFKDLAVGTAATTGQEEWMIDTASLTAGNLTNVISTTAGAQVSDVADDTSMVFYGVADASGAEDLVAVQFKKGARTTRFWYFEQVYAYEYPVGYSYDMAEYGPNDTVQILMELRAGAVVVTGEDYKWVVLGILAEPKTRSKAETGV